MLVEIDGYIKHVHACKPLLKALSVYNDVIIFSSLGESPSRSSSMLH